MRTLEFIRVHMVGGKGVFHLYEHGTGRKHGEGQLDANAWAALGFLESYRLARVEAHRQAADRVLASTLSALFDPRRGAFADDKASAPPLDANGVMAEALLRAAALGRRPEYLDVGRRVLAALDAPIHAILVEDQDGTARVADSVYYLRAYARVVGRAEGDGPRR